MSLRAQTQSVTTRPTDPNAGSDNARRQKAQEWTLKPNCRCRQTDAVLQQCSPRTRCMPQHPGTQRRTRNHGRSVPTNTQHTFSCTAKLRDTSTARIDHRGSLAAPVPPQYETGRPTEAPCPKQPFLRSFPQTLCLCSSLPRCQMYDVQHLNHNTLLLDVKQCYPKVCD